MTLARLAAGALHRARRLGYQVPHNVALLRHGAPAHPRVYLPAWPVRRHQCWDTYESHPALSYTVYPLADLAHWFSCAPKILNKPYLVEVEHVLAMGGNISDWPRGLGAVERINRTIADRRCRGVLFFSQGLLAHSRRYVWPDLWPKLSVIHIAYPRQPVADRRPGPFTLLTIGSRWSDKGLPEILDAYRALRQRFGREVRMILVTSVKPPAVTLPEGVEHLDVPKMDEATKARVYRAADALVLPCYSETICCFNEAYAFGVPVVTTRIHHGDEFVVDGETGHLLDTPVYSYSEGYGTRWRTWPEFLADLARMRRRGAFRPLVDAVVEAVTGLIRDRDRLATMRSAARRFHAAHFAPEVRNARLVASYGHASTS